MKNIWINLSFLAVVVGIGSFVSYSVHAAADPFSPAGAARSELSAACKELYKYDINQYNACMYRAARGLPLFSGAPAPQSNPGDDKEEPLPPAGWVPPVIGGAPMMTPCNIQFPDPADSLKRNKCEEDYAADVQKWRIHMWKVFGPHAKAPVETKVAA